MSGTINSFIMAIQSELTKCRRYFAEGVRAGAGGATQDDLNASARVLVGIHADIGQTLEDFVRNTPESDENIQKLTGYTLARIRQIRCRSDYAPQPTAHQPNEPFGASTQRPYLAPRNLSPKDRSHFFESANFSRIIVDLFDVPEDKRKDLLFLEVNILKRMKTAVLQCDAGIMPQFVDEIPMTEYLGGRWSSFLPGLTAEFMLVHYVFNMADSIFRELDPATRCRYIRTSVSVLMRYADSRKSLVDYIDDLGYPSLLRVPEGTFYEAFMKREHPLG
jgi:hypothetical protein